MRESEARLQLALEGAELGIWRWEIGAGTRDMKWDARCRALFGLDADAPVTYEVWANSIPSEEDRAKAEANVVRALDPADPRDETRCEYRVRQPDGTIRWVSSVGRVFFEEDPTAPSGRRPRFMTGVIRDVTEAHLAEEARRERERHDRYFLDLDKRLREAVTARNSINTACEALGQELGADSAGFGEVQPDGEHSFVESAWSSGRLRPPAGMYRLKDGGEAQLAALLAGEAVIVADVLASPYTADSEAAKAAYAAHGVRSSITMALLRDGPRAILFVADAAARDWTQAEAALARGTLDRTWHAVERARAEAALRESEERFREIANLAPVLIWMSGSTGACTWFNKPWLEFTGRPMEEQLGNGWAEGVHPDDLDRCLATYNGAFERREPFQMDYRLKRHDGVWRIVNDIGAQRYSSDGAFLGYIGSCIDVTDQRLAEAALRESEERFRLAVDAAGAGTWEAIPGTGEFLACGRARELFGLPAGGATYGTLLEALHPEDRPRAEQALRRTIETGARFSMDLRVVLPSGAIRWVEAHAELRSDSEVPKLVGLVLDITERKRASDHIHMLMREVNHRSKNMLTLVQAVARQTVASSPDDFLDRFAERIEALAASQDLLVRNEWKGVRLDQLCRSQLAHFADLIGTRVRINGQPLLVEASAAQAIGMALHELATNAGKYGALSNDSGHVTIEWGLECADGDEVNFMLTWREHGGPAVSAALKRGFGSTVITEMAEMSLSAKVDLGFAVTGLTWRLQCNAKEVLQDGAQPDAQLANAAPLRPPRSGMRSRILVVEDEPLVAIEIAHILRAAGFDIIGPARAVAQALSLIGERGCDAAVLDINLGGETSEPVAGQLLRRGTPFITLSGYSKMQHPPVFSGAPALAKPLQPDHLVAELRRCLRQDAEHRALSEAVDET